MKKAFVMSYVGTGLHGWQRQKNAPTVQQYMEDAIFKLCGRETYVSGCGRTDAGVHAAYYVASAQLDTNIPDASLPAALNAHLPEQIAVRRAVTVPDDFDARFSCRKKAYTYVIRNSRVRDPFDLSRAYFYPVPLDEKKMAEAARHIVGTHDFAAFKSEGTEVKSTVRTVYECEVTRSGEYVRIRVSADGFLYNMVRTIAGTLIYVGVSKLEPSDVIKILEDGDRKAAGPCAPACGLYLTELCYGSEELDGRADR